MTNEQVCKHCEGELSTRSFYDEECVEGYECLDCGNTFLCVWGDFDEDEMKLKTNNK